MIDNFPCRFLLARMYGKCEKNSHYWHMAKMQSDFCIVVSNTAVSRILYTSHCDEWCFIQKSDCESPFYIKVFDMTEELANKLILCPFVMVQ